MNQKRTSRKVRKRKRKEIISPSSIFIGTLRKEGLKIAKDSSQYILRARKSLKSYQKTVVKKLILLRQYVKYYFAYFLFHAPKFIQFHLPNFLRRYGFFLFSAVYFTFLLMGIVFASKIVNFSIDREFATPFFFTAGAMVGGALAIVATFSLYTIQNASEHLPSGFYEIATDNKRYLLIFFCVSAISIILFGGGVGYGLAGLGLSALGIQSALFLIGLSFYLLYLLHRFVRSDVNPNTTLVKATKQAMDAVKQIYDRTAQLSKVIVRNPRNSGNITREQIIASIFQSKQVQNALKSVNFRLIYLFDYHDSLVATQQRSSALDVLNLIRNVLLGYLDSRKDNSLAIPEPEALLATTSDSKYFLQPNLERLISIGEDYFRRQDTNGIVYIVDLFVSLSMVSSKVKYLGLRRSENPILEQVRGNFDELMKRAIALNSLEGTFQGLRYYRAISEIAVENQLHLELNSLHRSVWDIASNAIKNRHEPVLGEVFKTYTNLINMLVTSKYPYLEQELSSLLRHLQDVTFFSYLLVSGGSLRDNLFTQTDISKPFQEIKNLTFSAARMVAEADNQEEKEDWQSILLVIVDELRQVLRDLARKLKNANHILILSFGQIITELGMLLIELSQDTAWARHTRDLDTQVTSYIHLPHWFMYEVKNVESNQSFDSLVEAVTQMGLLALQKNMVSTSQEAMKIIFQFANDMFSKEKPKGHYGFTEPRIVENACYIGILALKLGKRDLVQELNTQVHAFEQTYFQEHFSDVPDNIDIQSLSPAPDQLKREITGLVDNRRRWQFERWGLRDAREMLFGLVDEHDIEAFMAFVWPEEENG